LVGSAACAQGSALSSANGSALGDVSSGWINAGDRTLRPTPTMERFRQEQINRGWAFLNANAKTREDLIALADQCHRSVSRPDYCAIPEMTNIAYHGPRDLGKARPRS
jgi:hypothetical protein